jgi:hypothetical protein
MDPSSATQNELRHLNGSEVAGHRHKLIRHCQKRARQIRLQRSKHNKRVPKFSKQKMAIKARSQDHSERIGFMFDGD